MTLIMITMKVMLIEIIVIMISIIVKAILIADLEVDFSEQPQARYVALDWICLEYCAYISLV